MSEAVRLGVPEEGPDFDAPLLEEDDDGAERRLASEPAGPRRGALLALTGAGALALALLLVLGGGRETTSTSESPATPTPREDGAPAWLVPSDTGPNDALVPPPFLPGAAALPPSADTAATESAVVETAAPGTVPAAMPAAEPDARETAFRSALRSRPLGAQSGATLSAPATASPAAAVPAAPSVPDLAAWEADALAQAMASAGPPGGLSPTAAAPTATAPPTGARAPLSVAPRSVAGGAAHLPAGTLIEGRLITAVRSDRPGGVVGLVTRDVRATSGMVVLPRGSRLYGEAETGTAVGAERLLVRWTVLRLPDGRTYEVPGLGTSDREGGGGLPARVDRRMREAVVPALLASVIGAAIALATPTPDSTGGLDAADALRASSAAELARAAEAATRRATELPWILRAERLTPFLIVLDRDLVLLPR